MNVIITRDSMCSLSACIWNAIDKQYNVILAVYWIQAVNSQGWAYQTEGKSQAETHPLARGKNSNAITLLQECRLLTLAVLPSNYGSLKSLDAAFALPFKAMTYQLDVLHIFLWHSAIWLELQRICSGDRSGIGVRPDPRTLAPDYNLPPSPLTIFGKQDCKLSPLGQTYLMFCCSSLVS